MNSIPSTIFFFQFMIFSLSSKEQSVVTGHIFAEIVESVTLSKNKSLEFSPLISPSTNITERGSFIITGQENTIFSVTLPKEPINLINKKNNSKIQISDWSSAFNTHQTIIKNGTKTITIEATIFTKNLSSKLNGEFSGTYDITFNYN